LIFNLRYVMAQKSDEVRSCKMTYTPIFFVSLHVITKKKSPQTFTGPVLGETRDNYAITKQESTQITIKLRKKKTRATSEGIPSSIDIEFLESNDNPDINALT